MSQNDLQEKLCAAVLEAAKIAGTESRPNTGLGRNNEYWSKYLKAKSLSGRAAGTNLGSNYLRPFWELIEKTNSYKEFSETLFYDYRLKKQCGKGCSLDRNHKHEGGVDVTSPLDVIGIALSECSSWKPDIDEVRRISNQFTDYLSSDYTDLHIFLILENIEFPSLPIVFDRDSQIKKPTPGEDSLRKKFNPSRHPFYLIFYRIITVKKESINNSSHVENEAMRIFSLLHLISEGMVHLPEYYYGNQGWRSTFDFSSIDGGHVVLPCGRGKTMRPLPEEIDKIRTYWEIVSKLNWDRRDWPVISLNRFGESYRRWSIEDRIVDLYSTLDSLLIEGHTELSFRLSISAARLLGDTKQNRVKIAQTLSEAAKARGGFMHGGDMKLILDKKNQLESKMREIVRRTLLIALDKVKSGFKEEDWKGYIMDCLYS